MSTLVQDLLTKHRSLLLVAVGLPVGMVFDAAVRLRRRLQERFGSAPEEHAARVGRVQDQVRRWASQPAADRKPMCTDRKTWMNLSTRFEPKDTWHRIEMSDLCSVLAVDTEKGTVRVEPFVTVGQITRHLLPLGYMLAVTLEIEEATVGGLVMAAGMTTHSHKAGMIHETVVDYEVVLADGSVVHANAEENADLFRALPWSHGTLGLLMSLELKIIPVKSHVRLTYTPARSQDEYCQRLYDLATSPDAPDFVEATVYEKDRAVIMTGTFASEPTPEEKAKVNPLGRFYKPWFYKHVEGFLDHEGTEFVPLQHYLSRHNRSIFWVVAHMIPEGNHPVFRALLGWMMPPKIAFLKFSTTPAVRKMTYTMQVFQDIVLPMSAMKRAIDMTDELFQMYPILLYPSRITDHGPAQGQLRPPRDVDRVPGTDHGMFFDLGVYGVPGPIQAGRRFKTVHALRRMEAFTREVGGYPFLYADTFMTRDEFREMFDHTLYDAVRKKYGAEGAFPDLYDKIKPEVDVAAAIEEERSWSECTAGAV